MDMFDTYYFYINRIAMSFLGLWPYQPRLQRAVLLLATAFWIGTVTFTQGYVLVASRNSPSQKAILIESISPLLVDTMISIKVVNSLANVTKMKILISRMQVNWNKLDSSKRSDILRGYAADGRRLTITYMIILGVSWFFYTAMPGVTVVGELLFRINGSHVLKPIYYYEYYLDVYKYQYHIFFHTMIGVFYVIFVGFACDSLFIVFVEHVCGLFAMIQYDILHIRDSESLAVDLVPSIEKDEPYHKLTKCIQDYNEALEFGEILAATYTTSFLFLAAIVTIDLSFTGAELQLQTQSIERFVKCIAEVVAEMFHFYFNIFPCQKLTDHSMLIREAFYSCRWYGISLRTRKLILDMLLRSSRPCQITAGRLCVMSNELFMSVLKTSMSYYTMLTSLQ